MPDMETDHGQRSNLHDGDRKRYSHTVMELGRITRALNGPEDRSILGAWRVPYHIRAYSEFLTGSAMHTTKCCGMEHKDTAQRSTGGIVRKKSLLTSRVTKNHDSGFTRATVLIGS